MSDTVREMTEANSDTDNVFATVEDEKDEALDADQGISDRPAVLLVHGLGGTQFDLGSMHKRLKNAGFVTHSLTLPGHGTQPADLVGVKAEDWLESVRTLYRQLLPRYETLHVMGMCMGSLLAIEVVKQERHSKGQLVVLAPPIFLDGWSTPWYRGVRHLLYGIGPLRRAMPIKEEDPFGIKNEQLRAVVKAKFERGENFHYQWVPLECIREVDRLRKWVMTDLRRIECQTLVVHAREDELTSLASANYVVKGIGGAKARMVIVENSYHMICVDNDKEIVQRSVLDFFGVPPSPGEGFVGTPRMAGDALHALALQVGQVVAQAVGSGEREALAALDWHPDAVFAFGGANAFSGETAGPSRIVRALLRLFAASGAGKGETDAPESRAYVEVTGEPTHYLGMTSVPLALQLPGEDTLQAASLLCVLRDGQVRRLHWLAADWSVVDGRWPLRTEGDAGSDEDSADMLQRRFDEMVIKSKTFTSTPSDAVLLQLYALFKQGTVGDADGSRPGLTNPIGRAKYDAWKKLQGTAGPDAMQRYIVLVEELLQKT